MLDRSENTTFYAVIVYQGDEVNTVGAIKIRFQSICTWNQFVEWNANI